MSWYWLALEFSEFEKLIFQHWENESGVSWNLLTFLVMWYVAVKVVRQSLKQKNLLIYSALWPEKNSAEIHCILTWKWTTWTYCINKEKLCSVCSSAVVCLLYISITCVVVPSSGFTQRATLDAELNEIHVLTVSRVWHVCCTVHVLTRDNVDTVKLTASSSILQVNPRFSSPLVVDANV